MRTKEQKERRKIYYKENKDELNKKRREHNKILEVKNRILKYGKEYRDNHKEKINLSCRISHKKQRDKLRELVFNHYGKECACCGERELKFLSIDHLNGNGAKHRKNIHGHITKWLVKNNFPKGFQTLCFNCNWGRYMNNGICPHKDKN